MVRRRIYQWQRDAALQLLVRAPIVHLATTDAEGRPILRAFHGVVVDNAVAFHAAPAGEKMAGLGRRAVVTAEEVIAEVPSYFVDPRIACPATSYYESVQVHGQLEQVDDLDAKARVLSALMDKLQPEGGFEPITATNPLYAKMVKSLLIAHVRIERITGKQKVGQNRTPAEQERIAEQLWQRGAPGDTTAIDRLREVNPAMPTPGFLSAPDGATLVCAPDETDLQGAVALLGDQYWNTTTSKQRLMAAHRTSAAWVVARDDRGQVIATARAVSDGVKLAWIADVAVSPLWQGRGLGRAIMGLLLDHPAVREANHARLATRDAQTFYQRFGFELAGHTTRLTRFDEMVLVRRAP